ncbi:hypothetical protein TWF730_010511 [Orbilia blumenaviensis]|uniref:F-box domain-containing protein n=1 Tax=Orbilia blumenaviensis TaxID=1796055 RepID=A0AAV9URW7_9PEZI
MQASDPPAPVMVLTTDSISKKVCSFVNSIPRSPFRLGSRNAQSAPAPSSTPSAGSSFGKLLATKSLELLYQCFSYPKMVGTFPLSLLPPKILTKNYITSIPAEVAINIVKFMDFEVLLSFSVCSRYCRELSGPFIWSDCKIVLPCSINDTEKHEYIKRNAVHVRRISVIVLVSDLPVKYGTKRQYIIPFIEHLPRLREFEVTEITPQSWDIRCELVGHLLTRHIHIERMTFDFVGMSRCPISDAYAALEKYKLWMSRPCRLKTLNIYVRQYMLPTNERGEYIFVPFVNLFNMALYSVTEFRFKVLGGPTSKMGAGVSEFDDVALPLAGAEFAVQMPRLEVLKMNTLCYFEKPKQFMTAESYENVRCLWISMRFRIPVSGVSFFGPPPMEVDSFTNVLQHFKNVDRLWVNIGYIYSSPEGADMLPREYWNEWKHLMESVCEVMPKLYTICAYCGQTYCDERGNEFVVLRTGTGILVSDVTVWTDLGALAVDGEKNRAYYVPKLLR